MRIEDVVVMREEDSFWLRIDFCICLREVPVVAATSDVNLELVRAG